MFFEYLLSVPGQVRNVLSPGSLLPIVVVGAVLAIPAFLAARAAGWRGVACAVLAPLVLAIVLPVGADVIRTFWPEQNVFAYGMAMTMYWNLIAFYAPFSVVGAALGLWRRRVGRPRRAPTA